MTRIYLAYVSEPCIIAVRCNQCALSRSNSNQACSAAEQTYSHSDLGRAGLIQSTDISHRSRSLLSAWNKFRRPKHIHVRTNSQRRRRNPVSTSKPRSAGTSALCYAFVRDVIATVLSESPLETPPQPLQW